MTILYDAHGVPVKLGKILGQGGEGAVYALEGKSSDWAAKVYHQIPVAEKREKLLDMVKANNESLNQIAAWPMTTLHEGHNGQLCGFVMPKLEGYQAIHQLYNPGQRKQLFPAMDWSGLIMIARNVAVAFAGIHAQGHVIGDVNPNLVFVAGNGLVRLIDCDSFQIAVNDKNYLCEVAVPQFTPPELQEHRAFSGLLRTVNHDNFGLALLLFHLLMMGRHPYAGIYANYEELTLESAIQQFRYAYASDNELRNVSEPPAGVTSNLLSRQIAEMFMRAFTETGEQAFGRPTATEWINALNNLLQTLTFCEVDRAHRYLTGLAFCPWCVQASQFGNVFFISHELLSQAAWTRKHQQGSEQIILFGKIALGVVKFIDYIIWSKALIQSGCKNKHVKVIANLALKNPYQYLSDNSEDRELLYRSFSICRKDLQIKFPGVEQALSQYAVYVCRQIISKTLLPIEGLNLLNVFYRKADNSRSVYIIFHTLKIDISMLEAGYDFCNYNKSLNKNNVNEFIISVARQFIVLIEMDLPDDFFEQFVCINGHLDYFIVNKVCYECDQESYLDMYDYQGRQLYIDRCEQTI